MKKKTVRIVLVAALAMSMLAGCIGCSKTEEPKEDVKKDAVKEESVEKLDDVKELLKYVPKADKVKIVEKAKDLNLDKILMDAVDEKLKSQVKEIQCDVKDIDFAKKGTYTVPVTLTLKESADSKDNAKAEDVTKKTVSEKTVIQTEIKIEVVSKEKVKELTEKGNLVVQADGKVEKAESKEKDAEKKDTDKKDEPQKPETSVEDKAKDAGASNSNNGNNSNPSSSIENTTKPPVNNNLGNPTITLPPAENQQTTPPTVNENTGNSGGGTVTPPPAEPSQPQHTHNWVQQYTNVYHEEVGHNEQVWIVDSPAWDEPIYEGHYICNKCGADLGTGDPTIHSVECRSGYHTERVQVGTTHHEEVGHYETNWVVDSPAWIENVLNGQKCSGCGVTK